MKDNLESKELIKPALKKKSTFEKMRAKKEVIIDIVGISVVAIHFNIKNKDNIVFTYNIYEIDRILEGWKEGLIKVVEEGIEAVLEAF